MKKINLKAKITKDGNTYYVPYHPVDSMYDLFYNKLGLRTSTNNTNLSYYLYNTDTTSGHYDIRKFLDEEKKSGTGFTSDNIKRYISFAPESDVFEKRTGDIHKKYIFTGAGQYGYSDFYQAHDLIDNVDKYIIKNDLNNYRYKTFEFDDNKFYAKTYEIKFPDVGYTINGTNGEVRRDELIDTVEIPYTPWDLASEHPNTVFTSSDGPAVHCYISCVHPHKDILISSETEVCFIEQGYYIGFDVLADTISTTLDYNLNPSGSGSNKKYSIYADVPNNDDFKVHVVMRLTYLNPSTGQISSVREVEIIGDPDWNYEVQCWYPFLNSRIIEIGPTSATGVDLANLIKDIDFGELNLNKTPYDPYPKPTSNSYISFFKIHGIADKIYCTAKYYKESSSYTRYFTMPASVLWSGTQKTVTLSTEYISKDEEMKGMSINANLPYVLYNKDFTEDYPYWQESVFGYGSGQFFGRINGICGNFYYLEENDELQRCFVQSDFAITGFIDLNDGASEIIGTSGTVSIQLVEVIEEVQE